MADAITTNNIGSSSTLALGTRDQSGDGTAIVAAVAGKTAAVKEISVWTVDPSTTVTVTLKFGGITFPAVGLSSARHNISIYREHGDEILCGDNQAVYVSLGGAVAVGVACFYDVR